jgi:hypothetical protein
LCERDLDGECAACKEKIFGAFRTFKNLILRYMEDMRRQVLDPIKIGKCEDCALKYADAETATVVRSILEEIPTESLCRLLVGEFSNLLRAQGVEEMPHLNKAWTDVCAKNGWSPV